MYYTTRYTLDILGVLWAVMLMRLAFFFDLLGEPPALVSILLAVGFTLFVFNTAMTTSLHDKMYRFIDKIIVNIVQS